MSPPNHPRYECLLSFSPGAYEFFISSFISLSSARMPRPRVSCSYSDDPVRLALDRVRLARKERKKERDMQYFYVIRTDTREEAREVRARRDDAWRIVDPHSKTSRPARFVTFRSFNNRVSAARQKLPTLTREPNRIGRNYISPIFQSLAQGP